MYCKITDSYSVLSAYSKSTFILILIFQVPIHMDKRYLWHKSCYENLHLQLSAKDTALVKYIASYYKNMSAKGKAVK